MFQEMQVELPGRSPLVCGPLQCSAAVRTLCLSDPPRRGNSIAVFRIRLVFGGIVESVWFMGRVQGSRGVLLAADTLDRHGVNRGAGEAWLARCGSVVLALVGGRSGRLRIGRTPAGFERVITRPVVVLTAPPADGRLA